MRISGTAGTVAVLVALAAVGGGAYFYKTIQENRKLELQRSAQELKLKTKEAEAKVREAEQKTKEAEARTAAARQKTAEADKAKAEAARDAAMIQKDNLKKQTEAAQAATKQAEAQKVAADAETKKAEAQKAAAEQARAAAAKKAEAESLELKRAEVERARAEAQLADKLAARKIAEAALAKSENERKTAEANAAAERDRKLRMYHRASTSRAEMLSLQRAERMLALDEAGMLPAAGAEEPAENGTVADPAEDGASTPATNAVVAVNWPDTASKSSPAERQVSDRTKRLDEQVVSNRRRQSLEFLHSFGELIEQAESEGRKADAVHYRRTLVSLVPDYVEIYSGLIDAARKREGAKAEEERYCTFMLSLIPDWQRVAVAAQLLDRDEDYYSRELAGRLGREEYVKAFRKRYDVARRDKGDRDERDAKVEHICKVLATYVPDFESSPEWK